MAIGVSNFQILSPEQANPLMYGIQQGLAARLNALQAQKAQEELPFVTPMSQQALQKAIYENMINKPYAENAVPFEQAALAKAQLEPEQMRAQMGLIGAQTGLTKQQAQEIAYKIKNGLLYPEQIQMMNALPGFIQSLGGGQQQAYQPDVSAQIPNMPVGGAPSINQAGRYQSPQDSISQLLQTKLQGVQTPISPSMSQQAGYMPQDANQVAQAIAQQTQIPAQQTAGADLIPGTNISRQDAVNAMVSKMFGIPMAAKPDPETVRYHDQLIDMQQKRYNASIYRATPIDQRGADISVVAPMVGGDYGQANRELMSGKTIADIAKEHGYDPNDRSSWPMPMQPPGKPAINRMQASQIGRSAFNAIEPMINQDTGMYSSNIKGYSPAMISDLIQNKNKQQVGRALAAVVANTEGNAMLNRNAGMTPGLGLSKMMDAKTLTNLKVPGLLLDEEVMKAYRARLKEYNDAIYRSQMESTNRLYFSQNPAKLGGSENQYNQQASGVDQDLADIDAQIAQLQNELR